MWVLEVARIRRLGSVGEVSAPAEELCCAKFLQIWRRNRRRRRRRRRGFPPEPRSDFIYTEIADARGSDFIYTEIADASGAGSIHREGVESGGSDFIYTEMRRAGGNEFFDLDYGLTYFAPCGARTRGLGLIRPTL